MVGLAQGLLRTSFEDVTPFAFLTLLRFSLFFVFGEGALVLSTECERLRLVRLDLASRLTVHQLLFPEVSFWILTNRLCNERLCLTEFFNVI